MKQNWKFCFRSHGNIATSLQRPHQRPWRDAVLGRDLHARIRSRGNAALRVGKLARRKFWRSPDPLSVSPRRLDAFFRALRQRLALELRQRAEDGVDQPTVRRRRVEMQVGDVEMDAPRAQRIQLVDGVLGCAVGAVEIPDHQRVAGSEPGEHALVDRPSPGDGRELLDVQLVGQAFEPMYLAIRPLLGGRHAKVCDTSHVSFCFNGLNGHGRATNSTLFVACRAAPRPSAETADFYNSVPNSNGLIQISTNMVVYEGSLFRNIGANFFASFLPRCWRTAVASAGAGPIRPPHHEQDDPRGAVSVRRRHRRRDCLPPLHGRQQGQGRHGLRL